MIGTELRVGKGKAVDEKGAKRLIPRPLKILKYFGSVQK